MWQLLETFLFPPLKSVFLLCLDKQNKLSSLRQENEEDEEEEEEEKEKEKEKEEEEEEDVDYV